MFVWKYEPSVLVHIPSCGSIVYIVSNWLKCRNIEIFLFRNNDFLFFFSYIQLIFRVLVPRGCTSQGWHTHTAWQQRSSSRGDLGV